MLIKGKRRGLSAEQKAELWNRWKAGQSLSEIGRALGKDHVVVHFILALHGGIAPPARRRSRRVLTLAEREDISRGIASGCAMRVIARPECVIQKRGANRTPVANCFCDKCPIAELLGASLFSCEDEEAA